jgi:hypothetical protein
MFRDLIPDLQTVVCEYAFGATLAETNASLDYLEFIRELRLHPCVFANFVCDYSASEPYVYDRNTRQCVMRPWPPRYNYFTSSQRAPSPFDSFFVWFAQNELFAYEMMWRILSDIDWRTMRPHFKTKKVTRARFMEDIESCPLQGTIDFSCLLHKLTVHNLKIRPSGYTHNLFNGKYGPI